MKKKIERDPTPNPTERKRTLRPSVSLFLFRGGVRKHNDPTTTRLGKGDESGPVSCGAGRGCRFTMKS